LGTDSHHVDHMENIKYAVYVARRGWAEKKNIINTRSLEEIEKMIL
jgi:DNA polymerase (family 10)